MQVTEKGLVFRLHSKAYRLTVSVASLKHSCLQTRSSVHSALEFFLLMRYINLHLLTYLLPVKNCYGLLTRHLYRLMHFCHSTNSQSTEIRDWPQAIVIHYNSPLLILLTLISISLLTVTVISETHCLIVPLKRPLTEIFLRKLLDDIDFCQFMIALYVSGCLALCVENCLSIFFSGEPGLAGFFEAKDDGTGGDNWSYKMCKAPVKIFAISKPTHCHTVLCTFCSLNLSVRLIG